MPTRRTVEAQWGQFAVVRTYDPEEMRHALVSAYGARSFDNFNRLDVLMRREFRFGSDSVVISSSKCFPLRPQADMPMAAPTALGLRVNESTP
jgi:hypothetical protein